jgi:hypothetical protein
MLRATGLKHAYCRVGLSLLDRRIYPGFSSLSFLDENTAISNHFPLAKTTFILVGEAAVEGPAERGLEGEGGLQVASPTQA